jgi:hypothetical protein
MTTDSDRLVAEFLTLFRQVREAADGDPRKLYEDTRKDGQLEQRCLQLFRVLQKLRQAEGESASGFISPVNAEFVKQFRHCEEVYEMALEQIDFRHTMKSLIGAEWPDTFVPENFYGVCWERAKIGGSSRALCVDKCIDFAHANISDAGRWVDKEEFVEQIHDGIQAWEEIRRRELIDLEGTIRRRLLLPFVFVPQHVSKKYGSVQRVSLYTNLREAQNAFVFGLFAASLALLRSIAEDVLKSFYSGEGENFAEIIKSSRTVQLPVRRQLEKLRKSANAILHLDRRTHQDARTSEEELLAFLRLVRSLIEDAPTEQPD